MIVYQVGKYTAESCNGVNEYLYRLGNLLKDDMEINFVDFDLPDGRSFESQKTDGITMYHFAQCGLRGFRVPEDFKRWLDDQPKDAVFQLHSVFRPINFTLARLLMAKRFKYIHTPHDSYSPGSLKTNRMAKLAYLTLFEKYVLERAALVHAISSQGYEHIRNFTRNRIEVVTNFIEDIGLDSDPTQADHNIVFVGRFDIFQKGLDHLLLAYREFQSQYDQPVTLQLVGAHKPQELAELNQVMTDLGLEEGRGVEVVGPVSEEEKYRLIRQAYVYCQLSRFEGFGLSIAEALSVGKPVITTVQVPIANEIRRHGAGRVVENPDEATQALLDIFSLSAEAYAKMHQSAKTCYLEEFSPASLKPKLLNMYEQALQ